MKLAMSVLLLNFLISGCMPEVQRQEERIKREVERSDKDKAREEHDRSQLGPNESSVVD